MHSPETILAFLQPQWPILCHSMQQVDRLKLRKLEQELQQVINFASLIQWEEGMECEQKEQDFNILLPLLHHYSRCPRWFMHG